MPKRVRAFVAIQIPEVVIDFLQQLQARIPLPEINIRWVAKKNIHLTLQFLGDIDSSTISAVAAQMDAAAKMVKPFSLAARGVGAFPNVRRARVLWIGLAGGLEPLKSLQAGLESGLESIGFKRESRDFSAHLTIGRIRGRVDAQRMAAAFKPVEDARSDFFRVDRLMLYKSVLKPNGPLHSQLHTSHLAEEKRIGDA